MALELQRYKLQFEYIKGKANTVADTLSRGATERQEGEETDEIMLSAVVFTARIQESSK